MLAEDDPRVRDALAALIGEEATLELVAAVADADEAVVAAEREHPDVALVDVRMPGGGGRTAARGITRRSPGTSVLALSAYEDRDSVLEMLEAGAVGYLIKGSPAERILESIKGAAEGKGTLSEEVTGDVIDALVEQRASLRVDEDRARASRKRIQHVCENPAALSMVFQPICALEDHHIVGVEELARFAGPPRQGPDRWFAEAAEVGLAEELELTAVRAALVQLPDLPPTLDLSLNVSPAVAAGPGFRQLLETVPADRIVVEITEHARIDDYEELGAGLSKLRELGARVAVDDAGAGFASLRHILWLDPQFIKLDRTLIDEIATDRSRQALAAGLISFAEKTGATIVAEGIEREDQLEMLLTLGVGYGQGYFLARPAPLPLPHLGPPGTAWVDPVVHTERRSSGARGL
jgi:EAL domain-containing protein (putative c-di-GMP-specific phosphodiesterase class I)/CheY-like chemotaxis protein